MDPMNQQAAQGNENPHGGEMKHGDETCGTLSWQEKTNAEEARPEPVQDPAGGQKRKPIKITGAEPGPAPKRGVIQKQETPSGPAASLTDIDRWLPIQYLLFAFSETTKTIPQHVREFMEECRKKVEEPDCHEYRINVPLRTSGPRVPGLSRPDDIVFPDAQDYRNLHDYFVALTPQTKGSWTQKAIYARTPELRLTGPLGYDLKTTRASEITALAKTWITSKINQVYDHSWCPELPSSKNNTTVADYRYDKMELERLIKTSAVCVVRGLSEALNLDWSIFNIENVLKIVQENLAELKEEGEEDVKIRALRQRAQPATSNLPFFNYYASNWAMSDHRYEMNFSEFAENFMKLKELAFEEFGHLETVDSQTVVDGLIERIEKAQIPVSPLANCLATTFITFGANFDIPDHAAFKPFFDLIVKFPSVLLPMDGRGMMDYIGETIAGVNGFHIYFKPPGARTAGHQENQLLSSVNINIGPGDCIWICIPLEYSNHFTKLLAAKKMRPYVGYWPDEEELMNAGIPVIKLLQKPGDVVSIGVGTYHWVQSNGFTINVAWNLGHVNFTQLSASIMSYDHTASEKYAALVPLVPMAWNMLRRKIDVDDATKLLLQSIAGRSLAKSVFELDFAEQLGLSIQVAEEGSLPIAVRCSESKCHRNVLFNLIILCEEDMKRKEETEDTTWCIDCFKKHRRALQKKGKITVYRRYSIAQLENLYDRRFF